MHWCTERQRVQRSLN